MYELRFQTRPGIDPFPRASHRSMRLIATPYTDGKQLRVGFGGEVPVFPPGFTLAVTLVGVTAGWGVDRVWWVPLSGPTALPIRVAAAAALVAVAMRIAKNARAVLEGVGSGVEFTPVNGIATTGPFAWSRNPMYCALLLIPIAAAILMDNYYLFGSTLVLFLYLDQVVIPAEELFVPTQVPREAYMAYSATVPRWFSLGIAQKIQELKEMKCPM
eukprot:m.12256 g.12256  ORF g.12256 m.12256 type:complete len:215 (-) comp7716_c0_seq1:135-779(-)